MWNSRKYREWNGVWQCESPQRGTILICIETLFLYLCSWIICVFWKLMHLMNQDMRVCFWSWCRRWPAPWKTGRLVPSVVWLGQSQYLKLFKKNGCIKDRLHVYLLQISPLLGCCVVVCVCVCVCVCVYIYIYIYIHTHTTQKRSYLKQIQMPTDNYLFFISFYLFIFLHFLLY